MSPPTSDSEPGRVARKPGGFLGTMSVYFLGSVADRALMLLLIPLLTSVLTQENYGLLGNFTALLTLLVMVVGLKTADYVHLESASGDRVALAGSITGSVLVTAASAALVALPMVLARDRVAAWTDVPALAAMICLVAATAEVTTGMVAGLLQMAQLPRAFVAYRLGLGLTQALLTVILLLGLRLDWWSQAYARLITGGIAATASLVVLARMGLLRPGLAAARLRPMLAFSLPVLPQALALFVLLMGDRLLLTNLIPGDAGLRASGQFTLAHQLALGIMLLAEGGMRAYKPKYFKAHQHRHGLDDLARLARQLSAGYILAALAYGGVGGLALAWLAPPRHAPLAWLLPPISMGFAFMGIALLNMCPYNCERRVPRLTALVVACAVAKLALGVPLIRRFGVHGASMAMMLGYALTAAVCWIARPAISPPRPPAADALNAPPDPAPA